MPPPWHFVYDWNRQGLPAVAPSRLFLYYYAREMEFAKKKQPDSDPTSKDPDQQGGLIRLAFKCLYQLGVCAETAHAYDDAHFAAKASDDAIKKALDNRVVQYSRIDPDQPEDVEKHMTEDEKATIGAMTLLRLRQCLAEGHPVVFGFSYYWKSPPWKKDTKTDFWTLPPLPSKNGPLPKTLEAMRFSQSGSMTRRKGFSAKIHGGGLGGVHLCSGLVTTGSKILRLQATSGWSGSSRKSRSQKLVFENHLGNDDRVGSSDSSNDRVRSMSGRDVHLIGQRTFLKPFSLLAESHPNEACHQICKAFESMCFLR